MRVSCNTSFAWLANQLGADALDAQAQAFGFGEELSPEAIIKRKSD